jgi:hypothetical protein
MPTRGALFKSSGETITPNQARKQFLEVPSI